MHRVGSRAKVDEGMQGPAGPLHHTRSKAGASGPRHENRNAVSTGSTNPVVPASGRRSCRTPRTGAPRRPRRTASNSSCGWTRRERCSSEDGAGQPQAQAQPLFAEGEVSLNAVAEDANYAPDGKPYAITLKTPHAGLHRIEAVDGGDHTRIDWPSGLPVTIESGIDSPHVTSQFRGPWTLHVYVPKGTTVIGGWSSRIANWAPRASGKLLGPDGRVAFDFGAVEEGWFKVPVPPGQDGTLWTFADSQGQRLLMTVPPYLARTGRDLLLPAEVVEADAGR